MGVQFFGETMVGGISEASSPMSSTADARNDAEVYDNATKEKGAQMQRPFSIR
jgi:hypothetical protein